MGRTRNYELGMYNEFEKLNKKLDKANSTILNMSLTINELNSTIKNLQKESKKDKETIQKLIEENERLKNQNNKNSSNSSKPSSTDINPPKKKTSANLYNYRIKTNKKRGGQFGHKGHNLDKKEIEKLIDDKKVEVRTITHIIKGNKNNEPIIKYRLGIDIKPYVEKHIFKYRKNSKEVLPKSFYTDVTYNNSIKALSIELGAYNVISYDRLSDFFNVITNGIINISNATLVNILKEFSNKSKTTINLLENKIIDYLTLFTDETSTKLEGKKMYVRNYSTEDIAIYKAHKNKGHKPIKEDNILPKFLGGIMGDHDTTLYSYGTKNYECNIHLGRYLEELIQNVPDLLWPILMKNLIFRMNETKKIAIAYGLKKFSKEKLQEYEIEYDEILKLAEEENKKKISKYYKDKSKKLYNRLGKYKDNHLYFIKNFEVPFDDNLSERDLRIFKNKTKISGGFRSIDVAQNFADALTIIKTSIKKDINPFDSIKQIFNNEILFN